MNNDRERLRYQRVGEGSPRTLVVVHGFLGGSAYWIPLQTGLKDYFDVIAVDLPGFGQSAAIEAPDSIEGLSANVMSLLDALNVRRFSLLGFSMGGMISQQLVLENAQRVEKLVLYGTAASGNLPNRFESWDASVARIEAQGVEATADKTVATWFLDGESHPFYPVCREACRGASKNACVKVMRAMQRWSVLDRLHEIAIPTLVVVGDKDRSTKPAESIEIWERIQGASLCILPGCAHGAHMEKPELFNRVLADFLLDSKPRS
jgi:pimeloyl-ACP methyl ester carboxylesterase